MSVNNYEFLRKNLQMIKNIILITSLLFLSSCNNGMLSSNDNDVKDAIIHSDGHEYIQLQIKMHKAYTLLKAFNSGVISQEEYDKLKKELI